jgi:hypothetical protein
VKEIETFIEKAQKIPNNINPKRPRVKHVIIKLPKGKFGEF